MYEKMEHKFISDLWGWGKRDGGESELPSNVSVNTGGH
jgi:hypothetical protein